MEGRKRRRRGGEEGVRCVKQETRGKETVVWAP